MLLAVPNDIILCVMEWLPHPGLLSVACSRFAAVWRTNYVTIRTTEAPPVHACPTTLRVDVSMDRALCRRALGRLDCSRLRHLYVRLSGDRGGDDGVHLASAIAPRCRTLHSFHVSARACHLTDAMFSRIPSLVPPTIHGLLIQAPMNSITMQGLTRFMDGLQDLQELLDLHLDVSGNWIRGAEYGAQLGRIGGLRQLRHLHVTFGIQGRRRRGFFSCQWLGHAPSVWFAGAGVPRRCPSVAKPVGQPRWGEGDVQ